VRQLGEEQEFAMTRKDSDPLSQTNLKRRGKGDSQGKTEILSKPGGGTQKVTPTRGFGGGGGWVGGGGLCCFWGVWCGGVGLGGCWGWKTAFDADLYLTTWGDSEPNEKRGGVEEVTSKRTRSRQDHKRESTARRQY